MRERVATHGRREHLLVLVVAALLALLVPTPAEAATDPYRPQQWHLGEIGAPAAWETGRGRGQVVAIVDSGVDLEHPDLADRLARRSDGSVLGWDFVEDDDDPSDVHGHGTMVAGLAAATLGNESGGAGVAPEAQLMPVRVLDEEGRGTQSDVDEGIRWAVDNGATVVNLSLESAVPAPGSALPVEISAPASAVRYAWNNGVVVVAAAGNSGHPFTDYPSSSPVLLVGATDKDGQKADFSDAGRDDIVMAPGVEIVSTWCVEKGQKTCRPGDHSMGRGDGTSFAAPQVAAGVALLRQLGLSPRAAVDQLRKTARDIGPKGPDDETGHGLVNLARATASARAAGTTTNEPSPTADPTPRGSDGTRSPSDQDTGESTPPPADDGSTVAPADPEPAATTPDGSTGTDEAATSTPTPTTREPAGDQAASPLDGPPSRTPWAATAVALLAFTAVAVGREWALTH